MKPRFDKKLLIAVALVAAAVALFVVGLFVLPETLTVQVSAGGQATNTMPRILGLLIPLALVVAGAWMYKVNEQVSKPWIVIIVGFAAFIATYLFNLL